MVIRAIDMVDHNPIVGDEYLLASNFISIECPDWIHLSSQNQVMDGSGIGISLPSLLQGEAAMNMANFSRLGGSYPINDFHDSAVSFPHVLEARNGSYDVLNPGCEFSSELSLSLTSTQPQVGCGSGASIQDQFDSYKPLQFLHGSRYLAVMQEMLSQITRYSLENLDSLSYPTTFIDNGRDVSIFSSEPFLLGAHGSISRVDAESKRKHLLALLQAVDDRYSQCLEELHMVVSAFHAATDLHPSIHTHFALQTVSFWYKRLRERISTFILAMGEQCSSSDRREVEEKSLDASFIQKQWALQQLRKKDHQLWRPQRGLPERSVSVLRAWMFQNFLHPYPKDTEKHLLAVKSGLTRSQVSNWFINARVRLWKPMIEEMYAEMNRRNHHQQNGEEINGYRNQMC